MRVGSALRSQWSERSINSEVAITADHASDVRNEEIHPASISVGDFQVIDAEGRWVGQPITIAGGPEIDPVEVAARLK